HERAGRPRPRRAARERHPGEAAPRRGAHAPRAAGRPEELGRPGKAARRGVRLVPVGGTGYDDAVIRILLATLWLAASSAFAGIEVLPGSSPQTGVINQPLPNPVRLRVTDGG